MSNNRGEYSPRLFDNTSVQKNSLRRFTITIICGVCRESHAQNEVVAGLGQVHIVCMDVF
jgi:hypothetical protein